MGASRPLDIMVVEPAIDPELPLNLYERLRTAMTVRSIPHGAQALRLIEAGADPDIILVDRRTRGLDVAAMQRVLALRAATTRTRLSFIEDGCALLSDTDAGEPIALLHGIDRLHQSGEPEREADTDPG